MIRRLTTTIAAIAILATACGGSAGSEPAAVADPSAATDATSTTTITTPVIASAARDVGPAIEDTTPDLDPEGIVAATVLIASGGDLEAAIAAGIVGEAEAEAALQALEDRRGADLFAD